jgi:hypothetical protein
MNDQSYTNLMTFWRNVEALNPQDAPKEEPQKEEPVRNWTGRIPAPWFDAGFKQRYVPPNRMWRHRVYASLYPRERFIDLLESHLGKQSDVFEARPGGKSCVFSVAFDEKGRPIVSSMNISMSAWAFGVIATQGLDALDGRVKCDVEDLHDAEFPGDDLGSNSGFNCLDEQVDKLRGELAWRLGHLPEDQPIDYEWFADFLRLVNDKLHLGDLVGTQPECRIQSSRVLRPKEPKPGDKQSEKKPPVIAEDDLLNSFYVKDLNRLIGSRWESLGAGLRSYLDDSPKTARIDVRRDRQAALNILKPKNFPRGCWPGEHPLVWSQQVAINAMWEDLSDSSGLFAVNGPPGTGKTTLLRDVVAAVVVERAQILANTGAGLFGAKNSVSTRERTIPYYELAQSLTGFSIVVASSNNGAVNNVSLELPKESAIHDIWKDQVDFYGDIASELIGEPAWAMTAGQLGNKGNRGKFASKFWWQSSVKEKSPDGKPISFQPAGLRERLEAIREGRAVPSLKWEESVHAFNNALDAEQTWRNTLVEMEAAPEECALLNQEMIYRVNERVETVEQVDGCYKQIDAISNKLKSSNGTKAKLESWLGTFMGTKPGILEFMATFGKSHREWRKDLNDIYRDIHKVDDELEQFGSRLGELKRKRDIYENRIEQQSAAIVRLQTKIDEAESAVSSYKRVLGSAWPELNDTPENQEKSSPWAYQKWREARIGLFIAALNLHRSFVENNASQMLTNLGAAMDMLAGNLPGSKERSIVLGSLALVCPVISTTFASVSSFLGDIGAESIGWLLIDEAGQATPQAAVGAIWRARRTVVVGDPLQIEPVVTLPYPIESALAAIGSGVDERWHPARTSAQVLADASMTIGTSVGEGGDSIWVGAPLRVHRRCDNPMFLISNEVAYDGLMVHQKKPSESSWDDSEWIDVPSGQSGDGNWIEAEGVALRHLVARLRRQDVSPQDIFIISPFRDVAYKSRLIGMEYQLDPRRIGTVHTAQGKESEIVILVLGGGTAGARNWAASKPNMLNVAVSRAKSRLYVIGDKSEWERRRHFDVLAREMGRG